MEDVDKLVSDVLHDEEYINAFGVVGYTNFRDIEQFIRDNYETLHIMSKRERLAYIKTDELPLTSDAQLIVSEEEPLEAKKPFGWAAIVSLCFLVLAVALTNIGFDLVALGFSIVALAKGQSLKVVSIIILITSALLPFIWLIGLIANWTFSVLGGI